MNELDHDLLKAAQEGDLETVRLCLKKGANPKKKDTFSNTSLHYACWNKHLKIVQELIQSGADVNIQNYSGNSSLHHAVLSDRLANVMALIDSGADLDIRDGRHRTALFLAAEAVKPLFVQALLRAGAEWTEDDEGIYVERILPRTNSPFILEIIHSEMALRHLKKIEAPGDVLDTPLKDKDCPKKERPRL